ncbi:restriction endonuclease [Mucilaginibacter robiniae]|uniref:Restriction endonuclease n=1 Tax=Mucilaginibacter robiniae TaxID=2728022 RepID=A0A7L5E5V6_9SPHI|nr:restriction endonuclease [Mucilaginibacter robiniae]QJD97154.1 restriction endonuclease [Mucilaginibacter robiniae]
MTDKRKQADFLKWFGPLLDALRELGGSGKPREVSDKIATTKMLSDEVLEQTIKSGESKFHNQVAWARQYLVWERLLDDSQRGTWVLTPKGWNATVTEKEARAIFQKWVKIYQERRKSKANEDVVSDINEVEPELVEQDYTPSLLEILKKLTPQGFEQICGLLLRKSGFEQVTITGRSNDGGIDGIGILALNPFVSNRVLFQCKRYASTAVSASQIRDFRGAMSGRAEKGIIITTSRFSEDAKREASRDGAGHIELVDGEKLVDLFQKTELGVKPVTIYEVDYSFFEPYL